MSSTVESQGKKINLESKVLLSNYIQLSFGKKMEQVRTVEPVINLAKVITQDHTETTPQGREWPHDSI